MKTDKFRKATGTTGRQASHGTVQPNPQSGGSVRQRADHRVRSADRADKGVLTTSVFNVSRDNVATLVAVGAAENVVFDSQFTNDVEASLEAAITDRWHLLANAAAQQAVETSTPQALTEKGNQPPRISLRSSALQNTN